MAEVIFNQVLQNTHEYNCENEDDNVMVSKIGLIYNNQDFTVEIKQPFGTSFEEDEGLELYVPENSLLGELNYNSLSDECEAYYRSIIGSSGSGIRIEGCGNIHMSNNTFIQSRQVDIPLSTDNGTTW